MRDRNGLGVCMDVYGEYGVYGMEGIQVDGYIKSMSLPRLTIPRIRQLTLLTS